MDPRARMIDANANRAREALRVMEDLARFALDDADLSARLKQARHDLAAAMAPITASLGGEPALLAWRDTPADVGTTISTDAESRRAGTRDIAAAAGKRLTEALRVIEECAKVDPSPDPPRPAAAALIESIRYRAYELERCLLTALGAGAAPQWKLCILITESLCAHHPWQRIAEEAIAGGADALQLREKQLEGAELLRRARWLVDLAKASGAAHRPAIIINDRPDIALLAGADAVHLGQTDLPVREAVQPGQGSALRRLARDPVEPWIIPARAWLTYAGTSSRRGRPTATTGEVSTSVSRPQN